MSPVPFQLPDAETAEPLDLRNITSDAAPSHVCIDGVWVPELTEVTTQDIQDVIATGRNWIMHL